MLSAQGGLIDGAAAGTAYAQAFTNSAFLNVGLQRTANDLNLTIEQKGYSPDTYSDAGTHSNTDTHS